MSWWNVFKNDKKLVEVVRDDKIDVSSCAELLCILNCLKDKPSEEIKLEDVLLLVNLCTNITGKGFTDHWGMLGFLDMYLQSRGESLESAESTVLLIKCLCYYHRGYEEGNGVINLSLGAFVLGYMIPNQHTKGKEISAGGLVLHEAMRVMFARLEEA